MIERCPERYGVRSGDINVQGQVQGLNAEPWPLWVFCSSFPLQKWEGPSSLMLSPSCCCHLSQQRLSLSCPFSCSLSTDPFPLPTHIPTFTIRHILSVSLSLPALGSAKLLKWMVSASTHYFTSSHSMPTIEGPRSFPRLDAVAPCQFSVPLTTWQHLLPHDPFFLID